MTIAETTDKAAAVAEQGVHVAPAKASSKKCARQKKGTPKGTKSSKAALQEESPATRKAEAPTNKRAEVIAMMMRAGGVTLEAIEPVTGWQRHTVRGFVSILGSKGGQKIESSKNTAGSARTTIAK